VKKKTKIPNAEERIMKAAVKIFHRKGVFGARMQEIADEAGIAKSMLHYHYDTKEKLFEAVFEHTVIQIFPKVNAILASDLPLFDKIRRFVDRYTEILIEHHYSAAFVLAELSYNSEKAVEMMVTNSGWNPVIIAEQIKDEIKNGRIISTDPRILVLNMFALTVFPFVGIAMHLKRFKMTQKEYFTFLRERKTIISETIINSIRK